MDKIKICSIYVSICIIFVSILINASYAFHENLGIDDNKASELYHSNPNDPAIFQWKNALQSAITDMDKDKCFDIDEAINCQSLISTIISNCNSHPNTLLACNDAGLAQYPSILAKAEEELKKLREAQNIFEKCMEEGGTYETCEIKVNSTVSPYNNLTANSFLKFYLSKILTRSTR